MNKLIGFSGKARSGKDSCCDIMTTNYGYIRHAFADKLKEAASVYFGIPLVWCYDDEKDTRVVPAYGMTIRQLLQKFGTESTRDVFGADFWINRLSMDLNFDNINCISDVRFDNEANWIRNHGGIIIHIERPSLDMNMEHSSELGIDKNVSDITIINDGSLSDLGNKVDELMNHV